MHAPDRHLLREALRDLPGPVTLVYYAPDVESWQVRAERDLLEAVAGASPRVTLEVRAGRWDAPREAAVGIRRTPALAVVGEKDHGIRYYGVPDAYELEPFLGLLRAVAEGRSGLGDAARRALRELSRPAHLEVLASPT